MIDCHTRELLGWHLSRSSKATTAGSALEHALIARFGTLGRVPTPFLLRSDNGLVFTSRSYTALVRSYRLGISVKSHQDTCPRISMSDSLSVVSAAENPRRRFSVEYKRQVVQESMVGGASIARVARAHGINANQLHNWRWQYRRGDFGPISQAPVLLPVRIAAALVPAPHRPAKIIDGQASPASSGVELIFLAARVVIHGAADLPTLRCLIQALRE